MASLRVTIMSVFALGVEYKHYFNHDSDKSHETLLGLKACRGMSSLHVWVKRVKPEWPGVKGASTSLQIKDIYYA